MPETTMHNNTQREGLCPARSSLLQQVQDIQSPERARDGHHASSATTGKVPVILRFIDYIYF